MILSHLEATVLPQSSLASGAYSLSIPSSLTSLEGLLYLSPLEYFFICSKNWYSMEYSIKKKEL